MVSGISAIQGYLWQLPCGYEARELTRPDQLVEALSILTTTNMMVWLDNTVWQGSEVVNCILPQVLRDHS